MTDTGDARRPDAGPVVPDPESAPPVTVPLETVAGGEAAAEPAGVRGVRVPRAAVALSAVLPGTGHVVAGAVAKGFAIAFAWAALLSVAWLARGRLAAAPRGSLDDWIALATLIVSIVGLWAWSLRDLVTADRRARERAASGDSRWRIAGRHFRRSRLALAGLAVLIALYLVALLAPLLAPYDPIAQQDIVRTGYLSPSGEHLLGTDRFGRDVLSRIIYGARISLSIGFLATAISVSLGTLLGAVAGYIGGKMDAAIMRFTDMVLSFPRLILLILIVSLFDSGLAVIILVLGLTQWPGTTRIVRGDVLSLREREFIQAARALGFSRARVILRHLVPNVLAPVIVTATLGIGNTIVLEAGLSFLGIGIQAPTPSWGGMVAEGRDNLLGAWWVATFPGLTIVLVVLAFNLVGDGLRDALDPRLRS